MPGLERVALTCSQYCTVSLQFFAEKRLHILRNCSIALVLLQASQISHENA